MKATVAVPGMPWALALPPPSIMMQVIATRAVRAVRISNRPVNPTTLAFCYTRLTQNQPRLARDSRREYLTAFLSAWRGNLAALPEKWRLCTKVVCVQRCNDGLVYGVTLGIDGGYVVAYAWGNYMLPTPVSRQRIILNERITR